MPPLRREKSEVRADPIQRGRRHLRSGSTTHSAVAQRQADLAREQVLAADAKANRARSMADIALYLLDRKRAPHQTPAVPLSSSTRR
jgi:hypothetical protein